MAAYGRDGRIAWRGVLTFLGVTLAAVGTQAIGKEPKELTAKGVAFFESKIRPVLTARCYSCHSDKVKEAKGGLKLDTREGIRAGGESGPAIVPNDAENSLLLQAIRHETYEMPPGDKLPDNVIQDFEDWIAMGAPDPRSKSDAAKKVSVAEARKYWAFQPPKKAPLPETRDTQWAWSDIDRWVLAGMEKKQLTPVADADRTTLIRRVTFDLTGLPPTPEEVRLFVDDPAPQQEAFATVVDRLLKSPQFGERWGRHWLDVARFGESAGKERNVPYPYAWRYRNWVFDAFNADMPYTEFARKQLAGDLLHTKDPDEQNANVIATGFLAVGVKGLNERNRDQYKMDVVDDQIDVTTRAFLGMTVACARCHDHKFDPISQVDYYAMAGVFCSTQTLDGVYAGRGGKGVVYAGEYATLADKEDKPKAKVELTQETKNKIAEIQKEIANLEQRKQRVAQMADNPRAAEQFARAMANGKGRGKGKAKGEVAKKLEQLRDQIAKGGAKSPEEIKVRVEQLVSRIDGQIADKKDEIDKLTRPGDYDGPKAMGVRDRASPENAALRIRGEVKDKGDVVPRGIPVVMAVGRSPKFEAGGSGRMQLAGWIANKDNPLTARVAVNRIWGHLFGRAIVDSTDNFGALAEEPTHPELLDWLALRFVQHGWSTKTMIREIVLSRTYQLSSAHHEGNFAIDGDNAYLWRMSRRRLEAEAIRDSILAVAGRLDVNRPEKSSVQEMVESDMLQKIGQALRERRGQGMNLDGATYRSVYLPLMRSRVPEALAVFDMVDPSLIAGQRETTTVAPQALFMMNSNFVTQNALATGRRVNESASSQSDRVDRAFELVLQRKPTNDERARSIEYLNQFRDLAAANGAGQAAGNSAIAGLCQALMATAEFRYVY